MARVKALVFKFAHLVLHRSSAAPSLNRPQNPSRRPVLHWHLKHHVRHRQVSGPTGGPQALTGCHCLHWPAVTVGVLRRVWVWTVTVMEEAAQPECRCSLSSPTFPLGPGNPDCHLDNWGSWITWTLRLWTMLTRRFYRINCSNTQTMAATLDSGMCRGRVSTASDSD